jgi:SAM-dependent methyltransferase
MTDGTGDVAADGSPVAVYLALPSTPLLEVLRPAIPDGASVLDLGCGVGRLANALAARGHDVAGVDRDPEMLAHLDDRVDAVEADVATLDLARSFDVVVLASHLVNVTDHAERAAYLATCRRHVARHGTVLIERYDPAWPREPFERTGHVGPVDVRLQVTSWDDDRFDAEVTYTLDDQHWTQRFRAELLDDAGIDRWLTRTGMRRTGQLDETGRWVLASPV